MSNQIHMIIFASERPLPSSFFGMFATAVALSPRRIVCVNLLPSKLAITSGVIIVSGDGIAGIIYALLADRYGANTAKIAIDTSELGCNDGNQ